MEIGGHTRAIAFERGGDALHAQKFTHCGFVRDQGQDVRTTPVLDLLGGELQLRFDNGDAARTEGLEEAFQPSSATPRWPTSSTSRPGTVTAKPTRNGSGSSTPSASRARSSPSNWRPQ
ncbi:hypothetical protein M878_01450 [Streptomyces roseochromogenus subsp. oscitans DS 12.976]|uniref:Uncharacterized protein n=1 Tax=Streptomyces roseochromogenus subsp. oscitans DS 12.976 TaxID=1352936 RepID=V6KWP1_STRRC|nr:hypothetical protein M878_01450 [Streptomyces roseochromogenus subsp. oscitans DS 12.976]